MQDSPNAVEVYRMEISGEHIEEGEFVGIYPNEQAASDGIQAYIDWFGAVRHEFDIDAVRVTHKG